MKIFHCAANSGSAVLPADGLSCLLPLLLILFAR